MEKIESFLVFKTFFIISKMDIYFCPIFILKKKFQKMKIVFFDIFYLIKNTEFLMLKGNTNLDENEHETISFFPNKPHFFRFFRLFSKNSFFFSGPFWPQKNEHHIFFSYFFWEQYIYNDKKLFSKKKCFFFMKKVALRIAP